MRTWVGHITYFFFCLQRTQKAGQAIVFILQFDHSLLGLKVRVKELFECPRLGLVNTFLFVYFQIPWKDFLIVGHVLIVDVSVRVWLISLIFCLCFLYEDGLFRETKFFK
jgi:hypothetical protein